MVGKGLRVASWPFVPGLDGAGIIEAVGDEVHNFSAGDEVLGMFVSEKHGGSFQKFAVVPAMMVARKPSSWSFEEAASLG